MKAKKVVFWSTLGIVAAMTYGFSAHSQSPIDRLNQQFREELLGPRKPYRLQTPRPDPPQSAQPTQVDINVLATQVKQLQDRVNKLEHELIELRRPRIIPANNK